MTAQLVAACYMIICPEYCHIFCLCLPSFGVPSVHQPIINTDQCFLCGLWRTNSGPHAWEENYRLSNQPRLSLFLMSISLFLMKQREWENQVLPFEAAKPPGPKVTVCSSIA